MAQIPYTNRQQVGISDATPVFRNLDERGLGSAFGVQVGRAISGLASPIEALAAEYQTRMDRQQGFDAEQGFNELNTQANLKFIEAQRNADPSGKGFVEGFTQTYNELEKNFVQRLPPEQQQRYAPRLAAVRGNYTIKAFQNGLRLNDEYHKTTLETEFNNSVKSVAEDQTRLEAEKKRLAESVMRSNLPTELKEDFARRMVLGLEQQALKKFTADDPETAAGVVGGGRGSLRQRESGNNPRSVNNLGYAGLYQFGAPRLETLGVYTKGAGENFSTWSTDSRTAPGKWSGTFNIPGFPQIRTLDDFLANPAAQEKVMDLQEAYIDKQIEAKGWSRYIGTTHRGVPVTRDGIVAGVHLGGEQGMANWLAGTGNAADANGTRIGDYVLMGARGGAVKQRFANLSLEQQQAAFSDGMRQRTKAEAAQTEQWNSYVTQRQNALSLGIYGGSAGEVDIQKGRAEGWLNDADTEKMLRSLERRDGQMATQREAAAAINDPNFQWQQVDETHKSYVNALSESYTGDDRMTFNAGLWQRTGILPDRLVNDLNNAVISTDAKVMERGVQTLANIVAGSTSQNPFAGVKNSGDLYNTAYEAVRLMDSLGMTSRQAAAELAKRNDPEYRLRNQKGDKEVQAFKKELTDDTVTSRILSDFATRTLGIRTGGATSLGLGDEQQKHVVSIYSELATKNFAQFGNKEQAMNFASREMQRMFSTDPGGRLVQYGPEKAQGYPEINGSRRWVYDQAAEAATAHAGQKIEATNVILTPIPVLTREAFTNGQPVPYSITYVTTDSNGMPKVDTILRPGTLRARAFVADPKQVQPTPPQAPLGQRIGASIKGAMGVPPRPPEPSIDEKRATAIGAERDRLDEIDGADIRRRQRGWGRL